MIIEHSHIITVNTFSFLHSTHSDTIGCRDAMAEWLRYRTQGCGLHVTLRPGVRIPVLPRVICGLAQGGDSSPPSCELGTMGRCSNQKGLCMRAVASKIVWSAVSRDHGEWMYSHVNTDMKIRDLKLVLYLLYFTLHIIWHVWEFKCWTLL